MKRHWEKYKYSRRTFYAGLDPGTLVMSSEMRIRQLTVTNGIETSPCQDFAHIQEDLSTSLRFGRGDMETVGGHSRRMTSGDRMMTCHTPLSKNRLQTGVINHTEQAGNRYISL